MFCLIRTFRAGDGKTCDDDSESMVPTDRLLRLRCVHLGQQCFSPPCSSTRTTAPIFHNADGTSIGTMPCNTSGHISVGATEADNTKELALKSLKTSSSLAIASLTLSFWTPMQVEYMQIHSCHGNRRDMFATRLKDVVDNVSDRIPEECLRWLQNLARVVSELVWDTRHGPTNMVHIRTPLG